MKTYIFGIVANRARYDHTKEIRLTYERVGTVMNLEDREIETDEDGHFGLAVEPKDVEAFHKLADAQGDWVGSIGFEHWGTFAENHEDLSAEAFVEAALRGVPA